ncbi:MAG: glycosyltransferase family 4 protein [Phycisphaerales bacterium]
MPEPGPILYLASQLPKLSETFVYREVLALREKGLDIRVASVHKLTETFDDERLRQLQSQSLSVYGRGAFAIWLDVIAEFCTHPLRTVGTLIVGRYDALSAKDITLAGRIKTIFQNLAAISLARRIRPTGIKHIHAHFAHVPTTIAMYTARQLGITFSFTGHANDLFRHRTMLEIKLHRAEFVSCISAWHNKWYGSVLAAERNNRPVIRCGVDTDDFKPIAQQDRVIVCVARLVEKKGIDTLIEACGLLNERGVDFTCKIAGDGPMRGALEGGIERYGVGESVQLLGAKPNDEIRSLVQTASVFCLPCRDDSSGDRDGIPVALMESMSCGVATVSGDLPAIRELIEEGKSGRLVPGGDAKALADVLEELLTDSEARASLGAGGRDRVIEEFSLDVNSDRIIDAFRALQG